MLLKEREMNTLIEKNMLMLLCRPLFSLINEFLSGAAAIKVEVNQKFMRELDWLISRIGQYGYTAETGCYIKNIFAAQINEIIKNRDLSKLIPFALTDNEFYAQLDFLR